MTNKQKRPDEEKTWRDQGSQNDRNRGGQQHQETDPQKDPRRQQGAWSGDEGDRQRSDEGQQQAGADPRRQQGGWSRDEDGMSRDGGRKPPADRDRDYDPDGDRTGRW